MTASGASYAAVLQARIEASFNAGGAATRMLTDVISPAQISYGDKLVRQDSVRGTMHPTPNAPIVTSQLTTLKGLKIRATYESIAWWLQFVLKGGVTGALTDTSAYTYTFTPSASPANGNDRSYAAMEVGSDVAYWTLSGGVCTRFGIKWFGDKPMEVSADFEFANRTVLTPITTLSPVAWEEINGSTFKSYLDATTLGSTAVAATEGSIEFTQNGQWQYIGDGNLYPAEWICTGYGAKFGLKTVWKSQTEYTAWAAQTERKARISVEGTLAGAATAKKKLQVDWYGYWDADPAPKESNGLFFVDLSGDCTLDATATKTCEVAVTNKLVTLP